MNFDHRPSKILVTGTSGAGKSTLWIKLLTNRPVAYRFIFDRELEAAHRLRIPAARTVAEMVSSLARHKIVIFDPATLFRGRMEDGFDFFCLWTWHLAEKLKGVKLLACDELEKLVDCRKPLGRGLRDVMDTGRRRRLDVLFAAQSVNEVHYNIRKQLTDVFTFRHNDRLCLDWLEASPISIPPDAVASLPYPGGYINKNLLTGECTTYSPRAGSPRTALAGKKA